MTLVSGGLHASTDIDLDSIRHTVRPIAEFFLGLAADWRGWKGLRTLGERPLTLSATHDGLGHITIATRLETSVPYEPDGETRADVVVEAGALDRIAQDAAQLPGLLANA